MASSPRAWPRLDQRLVAENRVETRSKAQQLLAAGEVEILHPNGEWRVVKQASLRTGAQIRVRENSRALQYVSRGGLKLEGALRRLNLDVSGRRCLDIGLSTGGFSDCLLQAGAAEVAGIDVGHGQVHSRLLREPRLQFWEGVHVRDLKTHIEFQKWLNKQNPSAVRQPGGGASHLDLCVVDVSFISLLPIFPLLAEILPPESGLLALVKPQFEVGAQNLNRQGVVTDIRLFAEVKQRVLHALEKCGFSEKDYFPCAVKGQDGNQEFFVYAMRSL